MPKTPLLAVLAFSALACQSAHADRIAHSPVLTSTQAPFSIELVDTRGEILDTYRHKGGFYVQGEAGQRYSIRVSNPTSQRVEAVVSVDGLDVIDGETANFRSKRGYIVPARGNLQIDGFRVSTQAVAAFRFSSVASSYAGRKGKARNVGVVGVAVFTERAQPVLVVPRARPRPQTKRPFDPRSHRDDLSAGEAESSAPPSPAPRSRSGAISRDNRQRPFRDLERKKNRPGLGTEFGERRQSAVNFTRFVRANLNKPTSIATLRYNDGDGLVALGIRLRRSRVNAEELATRESANPFPSMRFAQPPR